MSFHSLSFPVVNWKMKTVGSWGGEFSTTWFHRLCFGCVCVGGRLLPAPPMFPLLQQRIFCNCLSIFARSLFPFNIQHVWQKSRTVPKIIKPVPGIKWQAAHWFVWVFWGGVCRQYGFGFVKLFKIVFSVTSCGINKNIFSTVARAEMWSLGCAGAVEEGCLSLEGGGGWLAGAVTRSAGDSLSVWSGEVITQTPGSREEWEFPHVWWITRTVLNPVKSSSPCQTGT